MVRPGGETPANYGLTQTFLTPATTSAAAPIEAGSIMKVGTATAWTLVEGANSDKIGTAAAACVVRVEERSVTPNSPVGCRVLGKWQSVLELDYDGTAPVLGGSVEMGDPAAPTEKRKVTAVAYDGGTFVLDVDTTRKIVTVLV